MSYKFNVFTGQFDLVNSASGGGGGIAEYANLAAFPPTGESDIIYLALDTKKIYAWYSGAYVLISPSEVTSVNTKVGAVVLDKTDIGLGNVDNTSDANKPISTATQTALNAKQDSLGFTPENVANKSTNTSLGTSDTLYSTQNAVKSYVDTQITNNATPDATTLVKGKVKLAGDLAGTADLPTVPGLATKEPSITAGTTSQYWRGDKTFQTLDKSAVGLSNVDNTSDANKPISTATQAALNLITNVNWTGDYNNGVTYTVGDGVMFNGASFRMIIAIGAAGYNPVAYPANWLQVTDYVSPNDIGLGNVDNTSDVNKPISSATQTALNAKVETSLVGAINGVASLDGSGKVPSTQLPSYVDDVLEFANLAAFPVTGATGIIYVALDTNKCYRWSGAAYIEISPSEVNSVAGKTGIVTLVKADVGLSNVDNTSDANKPISTATQTALNAKEDSITAGTTSQYWRGDKTFQTLDKTAVGLSNVDNTSDANKPISSATQTALNGKANTAHVHALSDLTQSSATNGQVPSWNGTNWVPSTPSTVITDHTLLTNIGTNTHANIDTHIAATSAVHGVTGSVVGTSDSQALTNKTIDADLNTLSNIENADIKAAAAIDRTKLASGTADHVIINSATGVMSSEAALAASRGGLGTSGAAFTGVVKAAAGVFSAATVVNTDVSATAAIDRTKLASGTANRIVVNDGTGVMADAAAITASRALVSDSSGIPTASAVTSTELGYVSGVTSAIQTQINGKQNSLGFTPEDVANKSTTTSLGTSDTLYPTQNAVKTYVDNAVTGGATPDATTLVKGKVKLAGDLAGTADLPTVPGLATKEPTITAGTTGQYWRGDKSFQTLDKSAVGLANVDNTSDANKPISSATQTALNGKADTAHVHALSDLTQSAATSGQVPSWNGTNWVPVTPSTGVTDHTLLTNIGTNTHAQIDTFMANTANVYVESKEPTGFFSRTTSTLSFDNGTRNFSITPTGATFDVWVKGVRYTKTGAQTIQIPALSGNHFIYFDATGALGTTQVSSSDLFIDNALISIIYWNTDTNTRTYFAEERHGMQMDGATHSYLHTVFGAQFISGLALQGFSVNGNGSLDAHAQFTSDSGTIRDEDIVVTISAQTQIPVLYRQGLQWRKKAADAFPFIYSGTAGYTGAAGRIPFNEFTGGAWQLTQIANNGFVLVHLFGTNDIENPVVAIQGIATYGNVTAARLAASSEITSLSGLPFAEFVALGSVVLESSNSYTNTPQTIVRSINGGDYVDFRGTQLYTPAGEPTTHGLLSGLSSDDHLQYHTDARGDIRYYTKAEVDAIIAGITSPGDLDDTAFSFANNQSSAANVTGFAFANATVRSFKAHVSVSIDATTDLFEQFSLQGIQKGASWNMSVDSVGDSSGIIFSITSAGQVQYTSGNAAGFVSGSIKFRAITTTI